MQPLTISQYDELEHQRLEELLFQYQMLKEVEFNQASQVFTDFKAELERHIAWEESVLFPIFEQKTGLKVDGPTEVMRIEHRHILTLLNAIQEKVARRITTTDCEQIVLRQILSPHNHKEQHFLYRAIDELLTEEERKEIIASLTSPSVEKRP